MRHGNVGGVDKAHVHGVIRAFVHFHLRNGGLSLIQLGRVVGLQRPVEQFAALGGTRLHAFGAHHHGNHAAAVAFAGGHQVVAGAVGVAGFHTVHVGVAVEQQVAVGLGDVVVAVGLDGVERIVLRIVVNDRRGKGDEVLHRGVVLRAGQAGAVFKMCVVHAEPFGFSVHQLHKLRFAAGHGFGQGDGSIVAGLHNHPFEQIVHAGGGFRIEEHARAFRFPALLGHGKGLIRFEFAFFQRFKHQIGGHQLGERGGLDVFV